MAICQNCHSPLPDNGGSFCGTCGHQTNELPFATLPGVIVDHKPAYQGTNTQPSMPICRNCGSSIPDADNFCGMCGQQTERLTPAPFFSRGSISPNYTGIPDTGSKEKIVKPIDAVLGWDQNSPTVIASQPGVISSYPSHHQLSGMRNTGYQKAQNRYLRTPYLIAVISSLIILSVGAAALLIAHFNSSNADASNMTLIPAGKAIRGQTLQVVGHYFPPNQTVLVTLDSQPLTKNGATSIWHPPAASQVSLLSAELSGTAVTVQSDGTFTVTIYINSNWTVGSIHHLNVYNQQGTELKSLDLTVEAGQSTSPSTPTPTSPSTPESAPTPTPTPIPTAPVPTPTPAPTRTPTPTPEPSPTPTPEPTPTPVPTPTSVPTATPTD